MNILVQNDTGRVVHATDGPITQEAARVATPTVIYATLNASNSTVYEGVTPPTLDGGRYTYDGTTFTDTWPFKELTRVEFLDMLQAAAGITDAQLVAARADTNLGAFWLKFELSVSIAKQAPATQGGLNALVATGYLDAAGKQAILDAWPRARPA